MVLLHRRYVHLGSDTIHTGSDSGFRDVSVLPVGKRIVDVVNVDGMRSLGASSIQVLCASFHDLRQAVLALEDGAPLLKHPIISIVAYPPPHPHCTALLDLIHGSLH